MAQAATAHDHVAGGSGPRLAGVDEVVELTDEERKAAKKKKIIKFAGLFVVLLLVAHIVMGKVVKPHYPLHPANSVTFGLGQVTTNLTDGHLAQIGVTLQLTKAANAKTIGKYDPQLTSDTVGLIGQQSFASLLPAGGRATLRAELLQAYEKVLGLNNGGEQVSGVYFTSFVLQ